MPMSFYDKCLRSWAVLTHALKVLRAYPVLILPAALVWIIAATASVYLAWGVAWAKTGVAMRFGIGLVCIAALSTLLLLSCDVVVRLLRQLEHGQPSFQTAVRDALAKDFLRILPLALTWALIWFVLAVIESLLSRSNDGDVEQDGQDVAEVLSGVSDISFTATFLRAVGKGVRMIAFLIVPAIAWEGLDFGAAVRRGFDVLSEHTGQFVRSYVLTSVAMLAAALPAVLVLVLGKGRAPVISFHTWVWVALLIYVMLLASLSIYLEQLLMAQLFLWHLAWERATQAALDDGSPLPYIEDTPYPEMFARAPGLFWV